MFRMYWRRGEDENFCFRSSAQLLGGTSVFNAVTGLASNAYWRLPSFIERIDFLNFLSKICGAVPYQSQRVKASSNVPHY